MDVAVLGGTSSQQAQHSPRWSCWRALGPFVPVPAQLSSFSSSSSSSSSCLLSSGVEIQVLFSIVGTARGKFWILLPISLYLLGLLGKIRGGAFPSHLSHTITLKTIWGICLLQRAYAGTLFWHTHELHARWLDST